MPDTSTRTELATEPTQEPIPRQIMDREVKITRKAAFWVACSAGTLALVMFSLLFLHAAARNGWGPFGS